MQCIGAVPDRGYDGARLRPHWGDFPLLYGICRRPQVRLPISLYKEHLICFYLNFILKFRNDVIENANLTFLRKTLKKHVTKIPQLTPGGINNTDIRSV